MSLKKKKQLYIYEIARDKNLKFQCALSFFFLLLLPSLSYQRLDRGIPYIDLQFTVVGDEVGSSGNVLLD